MTEIMDAFEYDARMEAWVEVMAKVSNLFWVIVGPEERERVSLSFDGIQEMIHDLTPPTAGLRIDNKIVWSGPYGDFFEKLVPLSAGAGILGLALEFDFDIPFPGEEDAT